MLAGLPFSFAAPWLLVALAGLPVLWWLLRATPPAPIRRRFPAITLLLGLENRKAQSVRTPWWLLVLRLMAVAALIVGFAGPVLNPDRGQVARAPLLIFVDAGWSAAADWSQRMAALASHLEGAAHAGRPVAIALSHQVNRPGAAPAMWQAATRWRRRLPGLVPVAWQVDYGAAAQWVQTQQSSDTLWLSDGLQRPGRMELLSVFESRGRVDILEPDTPRVALLPAYTQDGVVLVDVLRSHARGVQHVQLEAVGPDPTGLERVLSTTAVAFEPDALGATARLRLPPELRNRITRFQLAAQHASGAVTLADDHLRRRRVALLTGAQPSEAMALLSPVHYLREALVGKADVIEDATLQPLIDASPQVIILPDIPVLSAPDQKALAGWVAKGGLLLRFAGPRLAAVDAGGGVQDILLPVRLRSGGRVVGGAMSWGAPRQLADFPENSPFFGLKPPKDVTVRAQILAEPGPELAARTIAALADGTPLVTRKTLGDGQVVLFHVSANAEWSSLVLSGLFVQMLERLAVSTSPAQAVDEQGLNGTYWLAERQLDAFGVLRAGDPRARVAGPALMGPARATVPPGLYADGDRRIAVNSVNTGARLAAVQWPGRVNPVWPGGQDALAIGPYVLAAALVLGALDVLASLWVTGRLTWRRWGCSIRLGMVLVACLCASSKTQAQALPDLTAATQAAATVTLAHVISGDATTDDIAHAGLMGLSDQLFLRTSVEPAPPVGVYVEYDDLSVYPFLYWPLFEHSSQPSPAAYERLKLYLAGGGFILFDTRDAGLGGNSATSRRLRQIALPLGLPPLEPVPDDHVLTRAFYLLDRFPGRARGPIWAEATPRVAPRAKGMAFRNLNDGLSPVMIGGNDWAGAWAIGPDGAPLLPVGRGRAGEGQREMAVRFGINLVMHVLTGNYKSDQVHVPALLERLGK